MPLPQKIAQDETQGRGRGFGGLALGTAGAAGAGGVYYGSRQLDKILTASGFTPGGQRGLLAKSLLKFFRASGKGNAAGLADYADASADMLNGAVAGRIPEHNALRVFGGSYKPSSKGLSGLDAMPVLSRVMPALQLHVRPIPGVGEPAAAALGGLGKILRQNYHESHFRGFPTAGEGVRTLVRENADYDKLTLQRLGRLIRKSLAANGWQANDAAARAFDDGFRKLLSEGYSFAPSQTRTRDIKPILEAVLAKVGPKATGNQIARILQPGMPIDTVLADAVKPVLGASPRSRDVITALMKTPAGMLAVQAASHTTRQCAGTHLGELTALGLIKALRSRKLRVGAGLAGGLSLAGGLYSALRNRKSN